MKFTLDENLGSRIASIAGRRSCIRRPMAYNPIFRSSAGRVLACFRLVQAAVKVE
jgi:hypothetical protein